MTVVMVAATVVIVAADPFCSVSFLVRERIEKETMKVINEVLGTIFLSGQKEILDNIIFYG
jgi:hypothetical protein